MIYVICPVNAITGGPDALHQLVYYLRQIHVDAQIAYCGKSNKLIEIPEPYRIYFHDFTLIDQVKDSEKNILIFPETHLFYSKKFHKCKIIIWWLSVDNNFSNTSLFKKILFVFKYPFRYVFKHKNHKGMARSEIAFFLFSKKYNFRHENKNLLFHMCASYYALDYVSKRSSKVVYKCIEPISKEFLEKNIEYKQASILRENTVLYNPVKSGKFVKKIQQRCPDLQFLPLKGFSQDQLIEQYRRSKLYIDFGPFPGAERMPKEAVLNGCLILTGKKGASNYHGDVPIPDEYKIEANYHNINKIIHQIRFMLSHYDELYSQFSEYRETVCKLEKNFIACLKIIFCN